MCSRLQAHNWSVESHPTSKRGESTSPGCLNQDKSSPHRHLSFSRGSLPSSRGPLHQFLPKVTPVSCSGTSKNAARPTILPLDLKTLSPSLSPSCPASKAPSCSHRVALWAICSLASSQHSLPFLLRSRALILEDKIQCQILLPPWQPDSQVKARTAYGSPLSRADSSRTEMLKSQQAVSWERAARWAETRVSVSKAC